MGLLLLTWAGWSTNLGMPLPAIQKSESDRAEYSNCKKEVEKSVCEWYYYLQPWISLGLSLKAEAERAKKWVDVCFCDRKCNFESCPFSKRERGGAGGATLVRREERRERGIVIK